MTQTKKYAILCSSEEEAIECNENGHVSIICAGDSAREVYLYTHKIDNARIEGYTIISYKEAVEMGLLGKKTTVKDVLIYEAKQKIKDFGKSYNVIGKIMEEIDELYIGEGYPRGYIEEILTKHLSSK